MISRLIGAAMFIGMGLYCIIRRRIPIYDKRPGWKHLSPTDYIRGWAAVRLGIGLILFGILFWVLIQYFPLPRGWPPR